MVDTSKRVKFLKRNIMAKRHALIMSKYFINIMEANSLSEVQEYNKSYKKVEKEVEKLEEELNFINDNSKYFSSHYLYRSIVILG